MKKIISLIFAMGFGASLFAITAEQYNTYAAVAKGFKLADAKNGATKAEASRFVSENKPLVEAITSQFLAEPKVEFAAINKIESYKKKGLRIAEAIKICMAANNTPLTPITDVLLTGGHAVVGKRAGSDKAYYDELKAAGFKVEGVQISTGVIMKLIKKYNDFSAWDSLSEAIIIKSFSDYIFMASKKASEMSDVDAKAFYEKIERRFTPYKSKNKGVQNQLAILRDTIDATFFRIKQN